MTAERPFPKIIFDLENNSLCKKCRNSARKSKDQRRSFSWLSPVMFRGTSCIFGHFFFEGLLTGSGEGLLIGSGVKKLTESRVSVGRTAEFKCDIPEDQEIRNLTVRTAGFDCKQTRSVQRCEKWRLSIPGGVTVPNATVAKHLLYLSKLKEG